MFNFFISIKIKTLFYAKKVSDLRQKKLQSFDYSLYFKQDIVFYLKLIAKSEI